jgi:protein phosphatase
MLSHPEPEDGFEDGRRLGPEWCRVAADESDADGLVVEFAQATRTGANRTNNEDAIGCWRHGPGLLFAVADGVGGLDRGEVASRRALDMLAHTVERAPAGWNALRRLRHATEQANLAIHVPGEPPMATTLTAALLWPDQLTAVHVGDCRLLRLRDGLMQQLTSDHNVAGRLASLRLVSSARASNHAGRRMVTRCLGHEPFVQIETVRSSLRPGDAYIQCSDGVGALPAEEMIELGSASDPLEIVGAMVERAVALGADDDVSVQVARIVACPAAPERSRSTLGALLSLIRRGQAP